MRSWWKFGAIALVGTGLACGGKGTNLVDPLGNQAPTIVEVVVDPETVAPGGSAAVRIVAVDAEGDDMTATATAAHGDVVLGAPVASATAASARAERRLTWTGTYANKSTSTETDRLSVTVRDSRNATSTATSKPLSIAPPAPTPTPEPTPTPAPTPAPESPTPPTPAPTITLAGDTSCYPVRNVGCDVTVTATTTDTTSISWGGCCGGSGTTATCHVPDRSSYQCTATATGGGGSTAATPHTVTGINVAPYITSSWTVSPTGTVPCQSDATFTFNVTDEAGVHSCPMIQAVGNGTPAASITSSRCPIPGSPLQVEVVLHTSGGHSGGLNYVNLVVRDEWSADSNARAGAVSVVSCP